jgi:glycosyltransferase involved in cell wall biosynthesis
MIEHVMMKISVVTPSYNQAGFIRETIESVLSQNLGKDLEFIVVDGGSTDGTLDILKEYEGQLSWTSEPDQGQADAVNKGVMRASGEIIAWLNSDDIYEEGALAKVRDVFVNNPDCQWLYGKCRIVDGEGQEIMKWVTRYKNLSLKKYSLARLMRENFISQPAVFFRKELFEATGPLDLGLNYALDYDLWLRFGLKSSACVINDYLSRFRRHGESKSETGFKDQFREEYEVCLRYGPSGFSKAIHWFNMHKIVLGYRLISILSR